MKTYQAIFLEGGLIGHVLRMAAAAYAALAVVQVADLLALLYVSWVESEVVVSGLSVAMTIFFLAFVVNIGCAIAVTAYVARSAVEDDDDALRGKATSGLLWATCAGALASLVLFLLIGPLCDFLGVHGEARGVAVRYLTILVPVNGVQAFSMACAATMRGLGKAREGMQITLIGGIANLLVDPLLILYFAMGVDGAAYGVWVGRVVQVIVGIHLLGRAGLLTRISRQHALVTLRPLARIAGPAAVASAAGPVGAALLMAVVAPFGDPARSAIFVVDRISTIVFGFTLSLAPAIGGIVAQNHASGNIDRILRTVNLFCLLAAGYIAAGSALIFWQRHQLVDLFKVSSPDAVSVTLTYMSVTGLAWIAMILINGANAVFQNTGRASYSMYVNWGRATLGMLPCWIAARSFGTAGGAIFGYVAGMLCCAMVAMPLAWLLLYREKRWNRAAAEAELVDRESGPTVSAAGKAKPS